MPTKRVEDGIRSYLESLGKSNKPVVDREAVRELKAQVRGSSDPIEQLRLLAALEDAEAGSLPDLEGEKAVFVGNAKEWAESEGIPVSAFQALKVPDDVLREAGFTVASGSGARSASRSSGSRAPSLPLEDVLAAAKKLGARWKLSDLGDALGREAATVRNYVTKLIEDGSVREIGDDPDHDGRGRAAKLYEAS